MALSTLAQDILRFMPADSTVYTDTSTHISVHLKQQAVLSNHDIRDMYSSSNAKGCDINFDTRMVHIWFGSERSAETILPASPRPPNLKATTVGERHALDIANTLGTIDYDNLEPSWRLSTTGDTTTLVIGRLYHISHDTLQAQLSEHCVSQEYQMHDKTIHMHFAAQKKRKMT